MNYLLILVPCFALIEADIQEGLKKLWDFEKTTTPTQERKINDMVTNNGIHNQNVFYLTKRNASRAEVINHAGTVSRGYPPSLVGFSFSKDGSLMAYQLPEGDADWRKVVIMHVTDRQVADDTLANVKFSTISWKGNEGIFYSKYYDFREGSFLPAKTNPPELYFHKLGTRQSADKVALEGHLWRDTIVCRM